MKIELNPEEIFEILEQIAQAGFTTYALWGGEPLFYPGIQQIVKKAFELGLYVVMCTNGSRLEELGKELAPYLHCLLLSLDAVGEKHNQLRAHPGLFQRALSGIKIVKDKNPALEIVIWSCLSRHNQEEVLKLAQLALELKVFLEFFPASPFLGCPEKLVLSPEENYSLFQQIITLKKKGFPIFNTNYSLKLMRDKQPFRCNLPRNGIHLLWDGSLWACDPRMCGKKRGYGKCPELHFHKIKKHPFYQKFARELEECNNCYFPCVAHFANNLYSQGFRRLFNLLYYRKFYSFPKT